MAWITYNSFKSAFPAAKSATDTALDLAFGASEDELVELIGQDLVTDAKLENPTLASSPKVIRAHSFLSLATFLLNNRAVKKEQSSQSAGTGSNNVHNEYYSASELINLSNEWRKKALRAVKDYLIVSAVEEVCETEGTESVPITFVW